MSIREVQVTFDCADPGALAGFWCEVLGYQVQPPPAGFDSWDKALDAWGVPPQEHNSRSAALPPEGESGPRLFFQRVPEGKTAKNRLHLDVRAAPGSVGDERTAAWKPALWSCRTPRATSSASIDASAARRAGWLRFLLPASRVARPQISWPTESSASGSRCDTALAGPPVGFGHPQKMQVGSLSISVRRSSMCGEAGNWS